MHFEVHPYWLQHKQAWGMTFMQNSSKQQVFDKQLILTWEHS